jgi:hypothetical protein
MARHPQKESVNWRVRISCPRTELRISPGSILVVFLWEPAGVVSVLLRVAKTRCPRRPKDSRWDSIRFGVSRECNQRLEIRYVCEKNHLPSEDGALEYDAAASRWTATHADARIQRMAECYVEAYLSRKNLPSILTDSLS